MTARFCKLYCFAILFYLSHGKTVNKERVEVMRLLTDSSFDLSAQGTIIGHV